LLKLPFPQANPRAPWREIPRQFLRGPPPWPLSPPKVGVPARSKQDPTI
jgi:hypothetical protein